jgi:hypothetical protein
MATRIIFDDGKEATVADSEDDVVAAVRRDHPNPVRLEGQDGLVLYVNWLHVRMIGPAPEPPLAA